MANRLVFKSVIRRGQRNQYNNEIFLPKCGFIGAYPLMLCLLTNLLLKRTGVIHKDNIFKINGILESYHCAFLIINKVYNRCLND